MKVRCTSRPVPGRSKQSICSQFATEEELAGHHAATVRGAIEGVAGGLAISLPASYYMQRAWPYYRTLPPHLKALGVILVVGPCYAIQAERRGVEFDKSTWTGAGKAELDREARDESSRWDALDAVGKAKDWAMRNQYKVIVGSWALSMVLAGGIVMRNRYVSPACSRGPSLLHLQCVQLPEHTTKDRSGPYVGTGAHHRRPHRRRYYDTGSTCAGGRERMSIIPLPHFPLPNDAHICSDPWTTHGSTYWRSKRRRRSGSNSNSSLSDCAGSAQPSPSAPHRIRAKLGYYLT